MAKLRTGEERGAGSGTGTSHPSGRDEGDGNGGSGFGRREPGTAGTNRDADESGDVEDARDMAFEQAEGKLDELEISIPADAIAVNGDGEEIGDGHSGLKWRREGAEGCRSFLCASASLRSEPRSCCGNCQDRALPAPTLHLHGCSA